MRMKNSASMRRSTARRPTWKGCNRARRAKTPCGSPRFSSNYIRTINKMKQIVQLLSATILVSLASAGQPTPSPTAEPRFKLSGWIDSGITFNPDSPQSNQNFGRLFDDRANEPLLNQVVINFERALVPQPGQFDWGFKLQFM